MCQRMIIETGTLQRAKSIHPSVESFSVMFLSAFFMTSFRLIRYVNVTRSYQKAMDKA